MIRAVMLIGLVGLWLAAPMSDAWAQEKRHAFSVGNAQYRNLGGDKQLPRSVKDAASVGETLKELGFAVTDGANLTRSEFSDKFQNFLEGINIGDTVVFFFSGHGIGLDGLNYLLPSDMPRTNVSRPEHIKRESLSVAEFMADMVKRKPRVIVLILDACRDNPLTASGIMSTGAAPGLASMRAPQGTFIMFSASDGGVAFSHMPGPPGHPNPESLDPDPHSVYTRKLLPLLRQKGMKLHELAMAVGFEVDSALEGLQIPTWYNGLRPTAAPFCFAGCDIQTASTTRGTAAPPKPPGDGMLPPSNRSAQSVFKPITARREVTTPQQRTCDELTFTDYTVTPPRTDKRTVCNP